MEWLGFDGGAAPVDDFWEKQSGGNVVPWTSWHEWNLVRDSLFSSSPTTALHRIRAWRGKGCLPAVVDITASLIEIHQKDPFFIAGQDGSLDSDVFLSQEMMSMLYCMSIIRLVNCVIERTRKRNGKSIAEAAEEIQIPRMLIDIRHEGSHRDLPSLEILRLASVEALEWLKMYYWNPQKDAVHFEDDTNDVQSEIEAKINEFAFMLTMKDIPKKSSSMIDKKRSKKQIRKALKNLCRLYLSFPCAVVDVLLNFMIKHYNSSSLSELHVGVEAIPSEKALFDDWEPVVLKLAKKDPNFIFTFLEAVLGKIQREYSEEHNVEDSIPSLKTARDSLQVHALSALFLWLVGNLRNMKPSLEKSYAVECKDTSEMLTSQYRIMKFLRICLHVATPDNEQLTQSSLILAQMTANGSLSEKLKKLLKHSSLGNLCFTDSMSEHTLEQQENDIRQAATEFELVKCSKLKIQPLHSARNADFGSDSRWGVAELWNQCVIGTLPHGFGSLSNTVPIADYQTNDKLLQLKELLEPKKCSCKRKLIDKDAIMIQNIVAKKLKETTEDPESDTQVSGLDGYGHGAGGVKGHLLLDGVWKRVGEEDISAIRSSVRIMT